MPDKEDDDTSQGKKSDDVPMEDEDKEETEELQNPLLEMGKWKYMIQLPDEDFPASEKAVLKEKMLARVKEQNMTPYYQHLCQALGWMEDENLTKHMQEENSKAMKAFDEKEKDATENLGDSEVRECKWNRAEYLSVIGEKKAAIDAYNDCDAKTVGEGSKIDLSFAKIRIGIAWNDHKIVKAEIAKAKEQVEKGGDWERRNLLGVYVSAAHMVNRELDQAAKALLGAVSTFTCYKLFDYQTFVFYTVLTSLVSLDRVTLKEKVIKSSEILQVIGDTPHLRSFLFSLYKGEYKEFFKALSEIIKAIKRDPYLGPHVGFYTREIRIVAYKQFLESYRSVTLSSMSETFGVSVSFLDKELSRFIAARRLDCKIDKVGGVVEAIRPDKKNAQYSETIKQGDLLLNRIQKLTKFINY